MDRSDWIALGGFLLGALGLLVPLLTIVANWRLKKYEVTFLQKRQNLRDLFVALRKQLQVVINSQATHLELKDAQSDVANELYGLLPFLSKPDQEWLEERMNEINKHVEEIRGISAPVSMTTLPVPWADYYEKVTSLRRQLLGKLF